MIAQLQEYLLTKLPAAMTPGAIALVDTLPRNDDGDLDARALLSAQGSAWL
jgi:hypothetical protein